MRGLQARQSGLQQATQRAPTSYFDPDALAGQLDCVAKLRQPGFLWDDTTYGVEKRGQGVRPERLMLHTSALREILKMCPSGFPCHAQLRTTLELLHARHQIFGVNVGHGFGNLATQAACATYRWRIICKDVRRVKLEPGAAGLAGLPVKLQELCALVATAGAPAGTPVVAMAAQSMTEPPPAVEHLEPSAAEVGTS